MKKSIIYFGSFIALALMNWGCDDTLDKTATPASEITRIIVELQIEQMGNPDDDSGLAPAFSTLVDSPVTVSSSTPDSNVAERVWQIPQLLTDSSLDFEEIVEMGAVTRSFGRPNNTTNDAERLGFPIILTETLNDGRIIRVETQVQVRSAVTAGIVAAQLATINSPTTIRSLDAASMGLSDSDTQGSGQVELEWDFGNGIVETPAGPVSTFISTDVNQSFNVIFDTATPVGELGELVTLTVTRNFPVTSTSSAETRIFVVPGLTPNRGPDRDPIKLAADGNSILFGYEQPLGDLSVISAADFSVTIDAAEISDPATVTVVEATTVTNVQIDPENPNNLLLTLSSSVPSILMDNVLLTFSSDALTTQSDVPIVSFTDASVSPTGVNLLGAASTFEDQSTWAGGGFFFPNPADTPELEFSTEQSFDGTTSMLFNSMGTDLDGVPNNFGIGPNIVEAGFGTLPETSIPGEYILSMWVYVESAETDTFITYFLLDFADFSTGAQADLLPVGEWIKITGTRTIEPGGDIRALIRVVNPTLNTSGMGRIFVDQVELRAVDDGR